MEAGPPSNKPEKPKKLCTQGEAEYIFRNLFANHDEKYLTQGIWLWLACLKDPGSFELFKRYPQLKNQYTVYDFLEAKVDLPEGTDKQIFRNVGLALCFLFLLGECWALFGKRLNTYPEGTWPKFDDEGAIKKEVLDIVPLEDFQQALAAALIDTIGKANYELFLKKLEAFETFPTLMDIASFKLEPALQKHMPLLLWCVLMFFFLKAVYCYFETENEASSFNEI